MKSRECGAIGRFSTTRTREFKLASKRSSNARPPGIANGLAFTISIDDYVITSLVAGVDSQTLPMVIYAMARRGVSPVLNAVSTTIVVLLGMLVLLSERLRRA